MVVFPQVFLPIDPYFCGVNGQLICMRDFTCICTSIILCCCLFLQAGTSDRLTDTQGILLSPEAVAVTNSDNLFALGQVLSQEAIPDSALHYHRQALACAMEDGAELLAAEIMLGMAALYNTWLAKFDSALVYNLRAYELFSRHNELEGVATSLYNAGQIYNTIGQSKEALEALIEAAQIREEIGRDSLNDQVYYEIAMVFQLSKEFDRHLDYLLKARQIAGRYDHKEQLAAISMSLSGVFEMMGQYDSTLYHSQYAFELSKQLDDPLLSAYALLNMGLAESASGNLDIAMTYFRQMMATPNLSQYEQARFNYFTGYALFNHQQYERAEKHLGKALGLATETGSDQLKFRILRYFLKNCEKLGKYREAYLAANEYNAISDKIFRADLKKEIAELSFRYETEKKEREILALQAKTTEQELSLLKTGATARNRFWWGVAATAFLLVVVVGFWIYFKYSQNRQILSEREASLQKEKLRQLQHKQKNLTLRAMLKGEEAERARLARELHDGVSILLSSLKMNLGHLPQSSEKVTQATKLVDKASSELRKIAQNMMPEALVKFGLIAAIEDLCDEISFGKEFQVTFQTFGTGGVIFQGVALQVYRILQELLNNVIKHAAATEVIVQLIERDNHLYITVEDNGRGFDLRTQHSSGNGLRNIKSRVSYLNGDINWEVAEGGGTTVSIMIELSTQDQDPVIRY